MPYTIKNSPYCICITEEKTEALLQELMENRTCYVKESTVKGKLIFFLKGKGIVEYQELSYVDEGIQFRNGIFPTVEMLAEKLAKLGYRLLTFDDVFDTLGLPNNKPKNTQALNPYRFQSSQLRGIPDRVANFYKDLSPEISPLIKQLNEKVKKLVVNRIHLTEASARQIALAILENDCLEDISLENVYYETDDTIQILFTALNQLRSLKKINCDRVIREAYCLFSTLRSNTSVVEISFKNIYCNLQNMYKVLCSMLQTNTTLKTFTHRDCWPVDHDVSKAVALATKATNLLELNQKIACNEKTLVDKALFYTREVKPLVEEKTEHEKLIEIAQNSSIRP